MKPIHGVNMGNWLVLEKWMKPDVFASTNTEDETWLSRKMPPEALKAHLKQHRDTYVTKEDFRRVKEAGLSTIRLPVPYQVFGDRPPLVGCIEYVDLAFDWAEELGLKILLDLHTVPGSQNGYDNGGLTGVCKWCKNPEEVEFALSVLDRLAERYGKREGLYGIEVLNEPISWIVYISAPSTGKAVDKQEAKGSGYVPLPFLREFYTRAYKVLRRHMGVDKTVVFHDGFRIGSWNRFFRRSGFENVALDTHIYIFAMEMFVPIHRPWVYDLFTRINAWRVRQAQKAIPVIVGEWCICNRYADRMGKKVMAGADMAREQREKYNDVARVQLKYWNQADGWFYWNYQLLRDRKAPMDESWKESWDFCRCLDHGWLSQDMIKE